MLSARVVPCLDPELRSHLIARALKDEEFRQELVRDPMTVLWAASPSPLPEGYAVRVLEEDEKTVYLVLPPPGQAPHAWDQSGADLLRAAEDPRFRCNLLANPRLAIERHYATTLPQDIEVRVVEESVAEGFLILPPRVEAPAFTPSDQMLEQLARGICWGSDTGTAKPGKGNCTHQTQTGSCCAATPIPDGPPPSVR